MENKQKKPREESAKLSKWHFASKEAAKNPENKLNKREEINLLGAQYAISPTPEIGEKLLAAFNPFLMKYVNLLKTGKITSEGKNPNKFRLSKDTKQFLALFSSNGIRSSYSELSKAAARLPNAFRNETADGVYNELAVLFLDLAQKFNGTGGFTGYIHHRFKWAVKNRMLQWQKDPTNYQPLYDEKIVDTGLTNNEIDEEIHDPENILHPESSAIIDFGLPELTPNFITQPPAPFDIIWSKTQRIIIYHKFAKDMSDNAINNQFNLGGIAQVKKELNLAFENFKNFYKTEREIK